MLEQQRIASWMALWLAIDLACGSCPTWVIEASEKGTEGSDYKL